MIPNTLKCALSYSLASSLTSIPVCPGLLSYGDISPPPVCQHLQPLGMFARLFPLWGPQPPNAHNAFQMLSSPRRLLWHFCNMTSTFPGGFGSSFMYPSHPTLNFIRHISCQIMYILFRDWKPLRCWNYIHHAMFLLYDKRSTNARLFWYIFMKCPLHTRYIFSANNYMRWVSTDPLLDESRRGERRMNR